MREFICYLEEEQPRIEAFLEQQAQSLDPVVLPTVRHAILAGGKRLRPLLTLLTARALGHTSDTVYPLACSVEMLHCATLLHDDIVDRAELRRGRPAAHTLFGQVPTVLAGDVLLALANRMVAEYNMPRLTVCLAEALMYTATGEIHGMARLRNPDVPEEEYLEIVTGKTARLIQAAGRCGAILARAGAALEQAADEFALNLGIAYQLVDDALDYAPAEATGKPSGGDLREGKPTIPLILYLRSLDGESREEVARRIKDNSLTEDELDALALEIRRGGFDKRAREAANPYLISSETALAAFPECEEKIVLSQALAYVRDRSK